jgi:hypothetical protein
MCSALWTVIASDRHTWQPWRSLPGAECSNWAEFGLGAAFTARGARLCRARKKAVGASLAHAPWRACNSARVGTLRWTVVTCNDEREGGRQAGKEAGRERLGM